MLRAIKIRLYPDGEQTSYLNNLFGSYRVVYNLALNYKKEIYKETKQNYRLKEIGSEFHNNWLKSEEYIWLKEHNTKVLKQSIMNMLDSYKRFFVNKTGFPKFKSKHDNKQSVRFPVEAISKRNDYLSNRITLTKQLKNIKFKTSDKYKVYLDKNKDKIKSATLTKNKSGNYYLSILIDGDLLKQIDKPKNEFIGLDLGIKTFIVDSNNNEYENIKIKRNNEKKLKRLHRNLSKKQKTSKNREKAKIKLAKFYEKLNNKKENYLHHVTNRLINENQVIIIEDLNVKGMMQNHHLAKSIQELSLYRFKEMLLYKAEWYNRDIVQIDRFFPSSKLCNNCGYKNKNLQLKDRFWTCPECGVNHDRDKNAAKNILDEGAKLYKENIGRRLLDFKPAEKTSVDDSVKQEKHLA